jgi:phage host-nuclease inhibitor protein Gam
MTDEDVEKVARASFEARIAFSIGHGEGRREHFIQFEQLPTDGRECETAVARAALDASPVSRLEAEVQRLRNENDVLRDARLADENLALWKQQAERASSERDQLAAEVERLTEALKSSCDDERDQIWETGSGGCARATRAEAERDQLAAEVAGLRRLVQAAITGLREWYGTDIFHSIESDCPEIAALVDALSSPKEERR